MAAALDVDSVTPPTAERIVPQQAKKTLWTGFLSFIWDSDSYLKSPAERRLLFKLDCAMLSCLCLGFFCKYLDQNNISNAYVTGMKEELGWDGNQFTYAQSLYTASYAIMQIPSTLIVQKVRPSWWLAFCEVGWAAFTFAQAGAHNTNTMYALRFLVGIFESAFFPVGLYLLGSWYTPTELAKRTAIFHFTAPAGTAFSGYLQAAIYTTLDGRAGLAGWRWLYIICGVMTAPCGFLVLFVLPNYPTAAKRWYLTDDEFELAKARMAKVKRVQSDGLMKFSILKRIFSGWHVYLLPLCYIFYGLGCQDNGYYGIWLKSTKKYSPALINILPTFISVIQAITTLAWGFLSDYTGSRFWFTFGPLAFGLFPTGVLAAFPSESIKLIQAAFTLCGVQLMTAVIYSWWSEICSADPLERALVIGMSNGLQYAMNAWIPLLIFKQTDSPTFRKGFPTTFSFVIIALILLVIIKFIRARDLRRASMSRMTVEDAQGKVDHDPEGEGEDLKDEKIPAEQEVRLAPIQTRDR